MLFRSNFCSASSSRIPFLATMPITMIIPMNDEMLNVVRVMNRARNTPQIESTADVRIASGAVNVRNSNSKTNEDQHHRQHEHEDQIPKRFLLHLVGSAV